MSLVNFEILFFYEKQGNAIKLSYYKVEIFKPLFYDYCIIL